jgi:hypothetical protein
MNCKLCNRTAEENGFCPLHSKAYSKVIEKFAVWRAASEVSWMEYLVAIQKNSLTGEWAKDVAKYLIEDETKDDK